MNTYRRSSQEQYAYSNDSAPIAPCYENPASPELSYHSSSSYNMMHPFSPYHHTVSPYYGPQAHLGLPGGTVMHPSLGGAHPAATATTRHEQQPSFRDPRYLNPPRHLNAARFVHLSGPLEYEVESQESFNEEDMFSEPVNPPLDGFPIVEEFDDLIKSYVNELSVKKQDKALINARRARNIRNVLDNPKDTAIESAQFRFWVKKMFQLGPNDPRVPDHKKLIHHEGKPVAIREKLFKILTQAHQQCQHGGRDKTSTNVRQKYSWVPKELISRFVKICPTCQGRRGTIPPPTTNLTVTPPDSRRGSPRFELARQQPHIYGSTSSGGGNTPYRRKSTAYTYSDSPTHHHHHHHHDVTWPDTSANHFHSESSERLSMKAHGLIGDAPHPHHHPHPHHLVETSQAPQYASSNAGFLATNANSRYSGY
ncbi:uncharacterized protein TRUGW13939_11512 [Talaromyces rugulosus]|uniref:Integrase zinc-binding domain-containing protein n=1 Tax=Talaromyces rugulosus TaxID=121627 RepID=A0A7H8RE98_TALRU|nr:uncharacterized protein TRUGW13939_11512 [Talaromyces rugulosus]QKX64338.1 hypothetical protein TRUGW13939_11512 [Talaromyces rugulosus]